MSVLVVAEERDPTADLMVGALNARDAVVHRVDTAWFPGQLSVSAELAGGRWAGCLRTPFRTIDLDEITAVWFRSPAAYRFPPALSPAETRHATIEAKYGLGGVLASLPALWVNHPFALAEAAYKPVQLAAAHRAGLHVMSTLITTEADSVRAFVEDGNTITKVLGSNTIAEDGVRKRTFTRRVDDADLDDLRGIEHTTHLFQRWAPKAFEVRVVVVGDTLHAAAIYAGNAASYVDWRADYDALTYAPVEVPTDVAHGIRTTMKQLGLVFGALDFVVATDGTWTFLEVNAGGQYGWLEAKAELPITETLADLLTQGAP